MSADSTKYPTRGKLSYSTIASLTKHWTFSMIKRKEAMTKVADHDQVLVEATVRTIQRAAQTKSGVIIICPKFFEALFCNCPISESPQNVIFHVCPISEMPQNVIFHVYPISEMPQNLILHDCPNYGLPSFFCTIFVT